MGEIITCDGCGKHSPNEKGLHIANAWPTVTTRRPRIVFRDEIHTMRFCRGCWDRVLATMEGLGKPCHDVRLERGDLMADNGRSERWSALPSDPTLAEALHVQLLEVLRAIDLDDGFDGRKHERVIADGDVAAHVRDAIVTAVALGETSTDVDENEDELLAVCQKALTALNAHPRRYFDARWTLKLAMQKRGEALRQRMTNAETG